MGWLSRFASRVRQGPPVGGDAITAHVAALTGAQDPFVFTPGEFDELEVHAYRVAEPVPHYLYITLGLSRVRSSIPVAGTQTELTLRVPASTPVPYAWPAEQLASMVALVRSSGNEIAPGHHMRVPGGGFTFVTDPILGIIDPPTGIVRFTYAVWVTEAELDAALSWDPTKFTGVLGDFVPLGLTDPNRADIMQIPDAKRRVERGMGDEGSSISAMRAKLLGVEPHRVDMDPRSAQALIRAARYRLKFRRPFALIGDDATLLILPDATLKSSPGNLQLPGTEQLANELIATFDAAPGAYRLTTVPLTIHVVDPQH